MARNAALLFSLAAACGCRSVVGYPASANIHLAKLKPDADRTMLGLGITGELRVVGRCVYLTGASRNGKSLAIWPATFRLWKSGGRIVGIEDGASGRQVRFGQRALFGGGPTGEMADSELDGEIPEGCGGPKWLLEFTRDDSTGRE